MRIIGLLGKAGSGKDTIAAMIAPTHLVWMNGRWIDVAQKLGEERPVPLVHDATQMAMADPIKTICQDVYSFDLMQLWGPSKWRNAPDERYRRASEDGTVDFLTPREALQELGTEWGRDRWANTWVSLMMLRASWLLDKTRVVGIEKDGSEDGWQARRVTLVVISDVRFQNEIDVIKASDGVVWKVVRDEAADVRAHRSESSMSQIDDASFDAIINNNGTFDELRTKVKEALGG